MGKCIEKLTNQNNWRIDAVGKEMDMFNEIRVAILWNIYR